MLKLHFPLYITTKEKYYSYDNFELHNISNKNSNTP